MNRLAVISAFLGGVKNRYIQYQPNRSIEEKIALASRIDRLDGLELCFPADFDHPAELKRMMTDAGLGVSAINVRSRRDDKWWRGSFTSESPAEREDLVSEFKLAMDHAVDLGCHRISTCPLNDGHDYPFEMNYLDAYRYAEECFHAICQHNPAVKVCIEYKWNDPRQRILLGTAGESLAFCQSVGAGNLGVTLDIGHSIQAHERPAQSVALLHRAGRLFYVHLNDNDRYWDWDMLPGSNNLWDTIEFIFYLREVGYDDDWFAYDVMSKEVDTVEHFNLVTKLTRKLEALTDRIDRTTILDLMRERNPNRSIEYLFDTLF